MAMNLPRLRLEPHPSRLLPTDERHADVVAAHTAAVDAGDAGYPDPSTGLFVFTAAHHLARGACCDTGCRHCPWVWDSDDS